MQGERERVGSTLRAHNCRVYSKLWSPKPTLTLSSSLPRAPASAPLAADANESTRVGVAP